MTWQLHQPMPSGHTDTSHQVPWTYVHLDSSGGHLLLSVVTNLPAAVIGLPFPVNIPVEGLPVILYMPCHVQFQLHLWGQCWEPDWRNWVRCQKHLRKTWRVWGFIAGLISWHRSWHSCWTAVLSQIPGNASVRRRLFFNILNTETCLNLFTHINVFKTY